METQRLITLNEFKEFLNAMSRRGYVKGYFLKQDSLLSSYRRVLYYKKEHFGEKVSQKIIKLASNYNYYFDE